MLLDLSPILNGEVNKLPFAFAFAPCLAGTFADVTFGEEVQVAGTVTDMAGYMTLALSADIPYQTVCARCLAEVGGVYHVQLDKPLAKEGSLKDNEEEEYLLFTGKQIDLAPVVTEELLLSFPTKVLCKEDCKGLCPQCGQDLNSGNCNCPAREMDPRWLVLKKLLEDK